MADEKKAALIARLDVQRASLAAIAQNVRRKADVPAQFKAGFARHAFAWLGGATFLGIVVARVGSRPSTDRRKKGVTVQSAARGGLLLAAAKGAFSLARPALFSWASGRIADYVAARNDTGGHGYR